LSERLPPKTRRELVALIFKIAFLGAMALSLILTSVTSTGEIPIPHDTTSLGTWLNMPSTSSCTSGNTTASICELFGNSTSRGLISFTGVNIEAGIQVSLGVRCINPSNTLGASLQLQYANYSLTTHTNSTNFVDTASGNVLIDNSLNWPCPGNLVSSNTIMPATSAAFLFRVVGRDGGGLGDNPRFSSVTVNIYQLSVRIGNVIAQLKTTNGFTASVRITYPVAIALTASFDWIATNAGVAFASGSNSCIVPVNSVGCSVAVTYGITFAVVPSITVDYTGPFSNVGIPVGSLNLLSAQTITV
jgi:hypothetical protein